MKTIIVLSALIVAALAAPNRITNGENAAVGQFPYQISFEQSNSREGVFSHICSGSILTATWVLTAGQCDVGGFYRIKAGITLLSGDQNEAQSQTCNVIKTIVHPDFGGGGSPNDLALLQLESPLVFNSLVQPIGLPAAGAIPSGQSVLSGWGSFSTTRYPEYPNHLQYANLPLVTIDECADGLRGFLGTSDPLTGDSNVCTGLGGGNSSACSGDSGGPLAQGNTIVGIYSWGVIPCGADGSPSVYTRVSAFIDFITSNVTDL